jgi:hypothetical protein
MSIVHFREGNAFGPQDIQAMSTALDDVCKTLNLTDEAKSERERLAKKIIALAQHGERSAALLRDRVLKELIYVGGKRPPDPRHLPGESEARPATVDERASDETIRSARRAMRDDTSCIPVEGMLATTFPEEIVLQRADEDASAKPCIAVIENGTSLQECLRRSIQSAFSLPVVAYSTVSELEGQLWKIPPGLVILSLMQGNHASVSALKPLLERVPTVPIIVLASVDDVDLARTVLRLGAKAYVPVTKGFEIAMEAVRFVLDGGLDETDRRHS